MRLLPKTQKGQFNLSLVLMLLLVGVVTAQALLLGLKSYGLGSEIYTHYNNYVIFKNSFFHLLENENLYLWYRQEQFDLFKYSPSFALAMGLLAYLPDSVGLFLWNALNALVLFFAIWNFKAIKIDKKYLFLLFIVVELITSMQNAQSNGLIAGLIVMAFNLFEKEKAFWAIGLLSCTVFIKIFGLVAFVLLLFYPKFWRSVGYTIIWFLILALAPLMLVGWEELWLQYQNWGVMLLSDHEASVGLSVVGVLQALSTTPINKLVVLLIGAVLFLVPLLQTKAYGIVRYRVLYLASILIWIVIFNHKAESPTFIISMVGIAFWYFALANRKDKKYLVLLLLALVLTSLSSTDLFPFSIREMVFKPAVIKVWPSILIWALILWEQLNYSRKDKLSSY